MNNSFKKQLNEFFYRITESLDITEAQYEEAKKHYNAVSNWLNEKDSEIVGYKPKIYPQGSFRIGTITKPINDIDKYDVDLVCELTYLDKDNTTQSKLKNMIGDRLRANKKYEKMLKEGKRCWTLIYSDSTCFSMDILPAIPNNDEDFSKINNSIFITDKELYQWQESNPIDYAEWFKIQMKEQFLKKKRLLAESTKADIEDIPDYKIKTTLQQAIQILKRHRDIMFEKNTDNKPISIIITTLAAKTYKNEPNLLDALLNIVNNMHKYIEYDSNGYVVIKNPVNEKENFADKWKKQPEKKEMFFDWLKQAKNDLENIMSKEEFNSIEGILKSIFGDRLVNTTAKELSENLFKRETLLTTASPTITINNPSEPWGKKS